VEAAMKRVISFIILILLIVLVLDASAQVGFVAGEIKTRSHQPIPGLTVSLVHPVVGRIPMFAITDAAGRFFIDNVPRRSDPYYLEIYWGKDLRYRNTVIVNGPVRLAPIIL
jgi:hypothetical protein